jgi:hypothetical protein
MMPLSMRRKSQGMEKVENLCRTARAQNELINTSEQFRSRLRDTGGNDRHARESAGARREMSSASISERDPVAIASGPMTGKVGRSRAQAPARPRIAVLVGN